MSRRTADYHVANELALVHISYFISNAARLCGESVQIDAGAVDRL